MILRIVLFPVYFLIVLPVEYGWWEVYKKEGKTSKNLIQFIWANSIGYKMML